MTVCVEYFIGPTSFPDSVTVIAFTEDGETGRCELQMSPADADCAESIILLEPYRLILLAAGVDYVSANVSLEFVAPFNPGDARCLNITIIDNRFAGDFPSDFGVILDSSDDIALVPNFTIVEIFDDNDSKYTDYCGVAMNTVSSSGTCCHLHLR